MDTKIRPFHDGSGSLGDEPLHLLLGPTASGKTDVAIALAAQHAIEVISADSRQIYRFLDVGTAKPSAAERARVPHHLVDVVDPGDTMSAGRFARAAWAVVRDVRARGAVPVVVGGAGLYVHAMLGGLADDLPHDPSVRASLDADAEKEGAPALHARLARVDPPAAARIAPRDRIRIVRALEVHAITGRPLSELQRAARARAPIAVRAVYMERAAPDLAQRIDRRTRAMLAQGLEAEARSVLARFPRARALLEKTVGYAEVLRSPEGADDLHGRIAQATRQYARRQRIWFQKMPALERLAVREDASPEDIAARVHRCWQNGARA